MHDVALVALRKRTLIKVLNNQSVRYVAITASVVRKEEPAHYFSRGQKHLFVQMIDADVLKPRQTVEDASVEEIVEEVEEEQVEPRRATG